MFGACDIFIPYLAIHYMAHCGIHYSVIMPGSLDLILTLLEEQRMIACTIAPIVLTDVNFSLPPHLRCDQFARKYQYDFFENVGEILLGTIKLHFYRENMEVDYVVQKSSNSIFFIFPPTPHIMYSTKKKTPRVISYGSGN